MFPMCQGRRQVKRERDSYINSIYVNRQPLENPTDERDILGSIFGTINTSGVSSGTLMYVYLSL